MLQLKDGVILAGNSYINAMLTAVQMVYDLKGWGVVITSGRRDGTGYHPLDRAIDVRCWMIAEEQRQRVAQDIKNHLPNFYDVVYEPEERTDGKVIKGAHFHIEADAKKEAVRSAA